MSMSEERKNQIPSIAAITLFIEHQVTNSSEKEQISANWLGESWQVGILE